MNEEYVDFVSQTAAALRQRKLAEMLRKQALASREGSQGGMVSGRYVKTAPMQHLANLFNQYSTGRAEEKAIGAEDALSANVSAAQSKWRSQLPQAMAAMPERQGPVDEANPQELMAKPALPMTMDRISQHALRGMAIPGNEKAAELYNKNATADLNREDVQAERANAAELKRGADRERDVQQAAARLEQIKLQQANKLTPDQQIMLKKMEDATKRYIADKAAEAKVEAAEKAAKSKGVNVKPVPNNVMKEMNDASSIATSIMEAYTTYKPEYGGVRGALDAALGKWLPGADKSQEEAANWWNNYEGSGLKARHDLFGATLTGNEASAWKSATIQKGQTPETIANNLATRAKIAAKYHNDIRQRYTVAGYPQIQEAFDELPMSAGPAPGVTPVPTMPPQQQMIPGGGPRPQAPAAVPQPVAPGGVRPLPPGASGLGFTRG